MHVNYSEHFSLTETKFQTYKAAKNKKFQLQDVRADFDYFYILAFD